MYSTNSLSTMKIALFALILITHMQKTSSSCPPGCSCKHTTTFFDLSCVSVKLKDILLLLPKNIEKLKLDANISQLSNTTVFGHLPKLRLLILSIIGTKVINDNFFTNLVNLERLHLFRSGIEYIGKDVFTGLENLKVLVLIANYNLTTIHEAALNDLVNLESLNIADGAIKHISQKLLSKQQKLKIMIFQNLSLSTLSNTMFTFQPYLITLKLIKQNISAIENNTFANLRSLRYLYLQENKLPFIHKGMFNGLSSVKKLHLQENKISGIEDHAFSNLVDLQYLSINDNEIIRINSSTFSGLLSLRVLELSNNLITDIHQTSFSKLINLEVLKLNDNKLTKLDKGIFLFNTNIESLSFINNHLSYIHENELKSLINLRNLNLNQNQLSDMNKAIFSGVVNLHQINLRQNKISNLPDSIFDNLTVLNTLSLEHNFLESINNKIFSKLTNLRTLRLDNNQIRTIPTDAFRNLTNLHVLGLSYNQITTKDPKAFSSTCGPSSHDFMKYLNNLQKLYLSHNNIAYLDVDLFEGNKKLRILVLKGNKLKWFDINIFKKLTRLNHLDVTQNKIECSCFFNSFRKSLEFLGIKADCVHDGKLVNVTVSEELCNNDKKHWQTTSMTTSMTSLKLDKEKAKKFSSIQMQENLVEKKFNRVGKNFKIEFEFYSHNVNKVSNILHVTFSKNCSLNNSCATLISFDVGGSLQVRYTLHCTYETVSFPLNNGSWYSVEISQEKHRDYYLFSITINDQILLAIRNFNATEFHNVTLNCNILWPYYNDGFVKDIRISARDCSINNGGCEYGCEVSGEDETRRCLCPSEKYLAEDMKNCLVKENPFKLLDLVKILLITFAVLVTLLFLILTLLP